MQAERAKEGVGSRGPKPEEDSYRTHRRELQAERAEEGMGSRGPMPEEESYRTHKCELLAERVEEGVGSRGPKPEEDSCRTYRRELQAERAEEGMGSRGPKPVTTEVQQQGYPFPDEAMPSLEAGEGSDCPGYMRNESSRQASTADRPNRQERCCTRIVEKRLPRSSCRSCHPSPSISSPSSSA